MLEQNLGGVTLLNIDLAVCRILADERARLRKASAIIGDFDLTIGATALRHGQTLLTNNRRHFERIRGLPIESL